MADRQYGFEKLYLAEKATTDRLRAQNAELVGALRRGVKWNDDGPCWCDLRRKDAALAGRKRHSTFCQSARAAIAKAMGE